MNQAIGELLPLALGVAISPIPIIATILTLLSPRARTASLSFLAGWVSGVLVAVCVFSVLGSMLPEPADTGSRPIAGAIQILLGALLGLLAVKQWRSRPAPGEQAALPPWMATIDRLALGKVFGLAFLLAAVNPKNLLLAASAGIAISDRDMATTVVAIIVFVVIAALPVAIPVVLLLLSGDRATAPLESLRAWLVGNNATIMAVLFTVLAAHLIGGGISAF